MRLYLEFALRFPPPVPRRYAAVGFQAKRAIVVTINGPEAQLKHDVSWQQPDIVARHFNGIMAIGIVEIVWFATHPIPYSTSV
jgi:hypothetical protein